MTAAVREKTYREMTDAELAAARRDLQARSMAVTGMWGQFLWSRLEQIREEVRFRQRVRGEFPFSEGEV